MSFHNFVEFDSNYFIPDISETPLSLEEILKQDDQQLEDILSDEDVLPSVNDTFDLEFLENSNFNAATSLNIKPILYTKSQISLTKNVKVNSGNPSCLTSSKNYIVVGTFNGHILVFDYVNEKLKWFWKQESEFGSVASLSINNDQTKLLCGGSKGVVSLWNINNGEMLRIVENLHAPFSSIINLKFLSDSNFAILSDTSGSVFILDVRKKDFDSNCIFTGSRGEVLSVEPLILEDMENIPDFSGLESLCLVAMATVSKVIVISVRPVLFVHFTFQLMSRPEFLPILSWNFMIAHRNKKIPLLAFGRQNQLFIHKMETDFEEKINFLSLYQFNSNNYYLQNLYWINGETFLLIDTSEMIHLIDLLAREEIETIDISHVELVYESSNYKSLVNGGYVSKAMSMAGEHACGNSFSLQRNHPHNHLFILGLNCVYELNLRTWKERVNFFIENDEPFLALQLLYNKYLPMKSQINVNEENLLHELISEMEFAYICFENFIFEQTSISTSSNESNLRKIILIFLKYAVCLNSKYERVFDLFARLKINQQAKCIFLECLECHIFNNELPDLNPTIVNEILEHYIGKKWYNLLDTLIVHFEISSLDIDHIVKISLDCFLYDSFLYIFNAAFHDFLTPFDKLLQELNRLIEDKVKYTNEDILLGNKLLVYLNCMLTCSYYPNKGTIESNKQFEHLEQVYARILDNGSSGKASVMNVLFKYDSTEFFNVILIAFDYIAQHHPDLLKWKQTLIDFFLLKIIEDETRQFGVDQQSTFFIFLSRCLISSDSIVINKKYFIKMIDSLFSKKSKRFEERQQILIQILNEEKFKHFYQTSLFLANAEESKMYKICEYIHRQNQDWAKLFFVYTQDISKENEIFDFIYSLLSSDIFLKTEAERKYFLNVIFENYLTLFIFNSQKAVTLFVTYLDQSEETFNKLINKLSSNQSTLFEFLKLTIFDNRVNFSNSLMSSNKSYKKSFELCLNPRYQEQYIQFVCQFEPENIVPTMEVLKECNDINILKICQKFNVKVGEAYIYEKTKQFKKSFEILFEDFKKSINEVIQLCFNNVKNFNKYFQFTMIESKFTKLLDFCKRSFKYSIEEKTKENFFLFTLEFLIDIKTTLNNINKMRSDKLPPQFLHLLAELENKSLVEQLVINFNMQFKLIFEKLINIMLTHLSLIDFFDIIINRVLQQNEELYDVQEMLLCILENYHYEKTLLELTNNILSCEHHQLVNKFQSENIKSKNVHQSYCGLCFGMTLNPCNSKHDNIVLFSCNHLFHYDCLDDLKRNKKLSHSNCPLCCVRVTSKEPHKVESNETDDMNEISSTKIQNNKLCFSEAQFRALNYFHHGRLKSWNRKMLE